MTDTSSLRMLKNLLWLDAATCSLMGAVLIAAAAPIAMLTALPVPLLRYAGVLLLPIAIFMAFTAANRRPAAAAVRLIVLGNLLWVAASLGLLASHWIAPNAYGIALIGIQALAVLGLAVLEHRAAQQTAGRHGQLASH